MSPWENICRRDLAALNIMRGRDNGLADYNTVRKCFGLPMINHFSEINQQQFAKHPDMFARLEEVYGGKITEHAKNIFIHHL